MSGPMYSWSIPSSLKAWIDRVHVMGLTARVPAMAPLRDKARADLEAARRAATDLAVQLGRRLLGDQ